MRTVMHGRQAVVASALLAGLLGWAAPAAAAPSPPSVPRSDGLTEEAAPGQSGLAAAAARPLFQLPFACGERWRLSTYRGHDDYDIDMINAGGETNNHPIIASYAGTVISAGWDNGGGNYVRLDHGNGWNTLYLHMIRRPVVSVGDHVKQGDVLGRVGSTGRSSGPHLHYEQNLNRTKIEAWFNGRPSGITDDATSEPRVVESFNCGTPKPEPEKRTPGSVTGDSYTDLVATKPDGTLWLYANNFARDDGRPYSEARQIGSGWNGFDRIVAADATGDGFTDLVATKPDGTMWLYANNFVRDDGRPYSGVRQIGSGWGVFDRIVAADATGDGFTDLVATKADGTMWLYANNFVRDDGRPYSGVRQIGSGWGAFDRIAAADATGDGFTDLVATKADGTMWLYANNIVRDDGRPYSEVRQIGSGWGGFNRIIAD